MQDGPYGPYIKMAKDNRSLENHAQRATITVAEAVALFAQPKRRGRAAAAIKELGNHPETELPLVIKNGRFGPYVTDGQVNASIPKGNDPMAVTVEEALALMARAAERKKSRPSRGRRRVARRKG